MRLLVDQDVYNITVQWLKKEGHDVVTASGLGMFKASDSDLLKKAAETNRLMVTRDKGYGALVFLKALQKTGVILLKITPKNIVEVHAELGRLLKEHKEEELEHLFCVVEPNRHRIRRFIQ